MSVCRYRGTPDPRCLRYDGALCSAVATAKASNERLRASAELLRRAQKQQLARSQEAVQDGRTAVAKAKLFEVAQGIFPDPLAPSRVVTVRLRVANSQLILLRNAVVRQTQIACR